MPTVGGSSSSRQPSRMFSAFEKGKWKERLSGEGISAAFGGTNFSWLLLHVRFSDWRHNIFSICSRDLSSDAYSSNLMESMQ